MSQRRLAQLVGLSQATVARIESGAIAASFEQVANLLKACGLELRVELVPADDADWSLAQANLRLTPEARVRQNQAAVRFIEQGRQALEHAS